MRDEKISLPRISSVSQKEMLNDQVPESIIGNLMKKSKLNRSPENILNIIRKTSNENRFTLFDLPNNKSRSIMVPN